MSKFSLNDFGRWFGDGYKDFGSVTIDDGYYRYQLDKVNPAATGCLIDCNNKYLEWVDHG